MSDATNSSEINKSKNNPTMWKESNSMSFTLLFIQQKFIYNILFWDIMLHA